MRNLATDIVRLRRLVRIGCVLAGAAAAAAPARGEEAPLAIHTHSAPFALVAQEGVWCEQSVTVANPADAPRAGKAAAVMGESGGRRVMFARGAVVPPKAVRRVDLLVRTGLLPPAQLPPEPAGGPQKPPPGLPPAQVDFVLWDPRTGQEVAREFRLVTPVAPGTTVVASVGVSREQHDRNDYLEHLAEDDLGEVCNLAAGSQAPARWYGYSIVRMLRLEEGTERLGPSQWEAIFDWVRRGGLMVIVGGRELPETLHSPLGRAAGVGSAGVHRVGRLAVTDPSGRERFAPVPLDWPLPMVELCPDGAEVLYEANGLPLVTRKALGDGWIFTLAAPTGALKDRRLHRIWWRIAQAARLRRPVDAERFFPPGRQALQSIAGRRGPPRSRTVVLLLVPVLVAVAVRIALRRRRRGELAWLVLIPLGVLMGVGMYLYSVSRRDDERLTHVGLITGLGGDAARVQELFAYYSGAERRTVTFGADSPRAAIRDVALVTAAARRSEVRSGDCASLPDRRVEVSDTRTFFVDLPSAPTA